jgi:hypothetical protein
MGRSLIKLVEGIDGAVLVNDQKDNHNEICSAQYYHKPIPTFVCERAFTMRVCGGHLWSVGAGIADFILAGSSGARQSKTILARSCEAGGVVSLRLSWRGLTLTDLPMTKIFV